MKAATHTVIASSGTVSTKPSESLVREHVTQTSVQDPASLAQHFRKTQDNADRATRAARTNAFSSGSRLFTDLDVTASVAFTIRHNLGRKVYYLAVRFENAGANADLFVVSDDLNSITLKCLSTGRLALLVF